MRMKVQLTGGPGPSPVLAEAFSMTVFSGSGYNDFMGYIAAHSSFFPSWNSFLGLGREVFSVCVCVRFLKELCQRHTFTQTYPINLCLESTMQCEYLLWKKGRCLHLRPLWRNRIPLLPRENHFLCYVPCVHREKTPLSWYWFQGFTNPESC